VRCTLVAKAGILALSAAGPAAYAANTRDFRCLWCSGVLPLWCSVLVLESGFVVRPPECGHGFSPRGAAGIARGSTVRGPGGRGGVVLTEGFPAAGAGYVKPGANTVTCGFPVMVCLVAVACGNFGLAFWARLE
jgi:hypothetical protein